MAKDPTRLGSNWESLLPKLPEISMPKLPDFIDRLPELKAYSPAESAYELLVKRIVHFESQLNKDQEIGARLVNFGSNDPIHIEHVGYKGQDFIVFQGTNLDGRPVELIQHVSQLNVLLVAVDAKAKEPRRIGFTLSQHLQDDGNE